jgi:hypothetical protein
LWESDYTAVNGGEIATDTNQLGSGVANIYFSILTAQSNDVQSYLMSLVIGSNIILTKTDGGATYYYSYTVTNNPSLGGGVVAIGVSFISSNNSNIVPTQGDGVCFNSSAVGSAGTSGESGTAGTSGFSGDKYATESLTSVTLPISESVILTVETDLSYTIGQTVVVAHDNSNFFTGSVSSYDSSNGELTLSVISSTGLGIYNTWDVNLDGVVGAAGTAGTSGIAGTSGTSGTAGTSFNGTYTGNIQVNGQVWTTLDANGNTIASQTIDFNTSNVQSYTLSTNTTFALTNLQAGGKYTVIVRQAAAASYIATFTSVLWSGGTAPTQTATNNKYDVYTFISDGTNIFGSYVQNF